VTKLWVGRSSFWTKAGQSPVAFATAAERDLLTYGEYKPGASTTGVLPGSTLTTYTAASQLPGGGLQGGATYTNCRFEFFVTPPTGTSTITFRNCYFAGQNASPGDFVGLLKLYNTSHCPVVAIDCTLKPQRPSRFWNGFHGHSFKAYRCDISLVVDAFSVFNNTAGLREGPLGVEVYGCWIHDFAWWAQGTGDTNASGARENSFDGSHSDGVQLQGGSGFKFIGNNVEGFLHPDYFNTYYNANQINALMMIKPDVGVITDVEIRKNYFDGGASGVNITHDEPDRYEGYIGVFRENLFGRAMRQGSNWAINTHEVGTPITWDGGTAGPPDTRNLYADTLTPVPTHLG
jgi:hypothetical protein